MNENKEEIKKAYEDILEVCSKYEYLNKYNDLDDIKEMTAKAKDHLAIIEWFEKYGLELSHEHKPYSRNYFSTNEYTIFSYYEDGEKAHKLGGGRYISWSDDDKQPLNEWLFETHFSTGAYIFGEDYEGQKQLFQDFFNELKSYKPDFSDSHNDNLYWKLENAKDIFNDFNGILNKYYERNREELKQRKIEKMEKELNKLKEIK